MTMAIVSESVTQPTQHTKPSCNATMKVFPYLEVTYLMACSSATPVSVAVFNPTVLDSIPE